MEIIKKSQAIEMIVSHIDDLTREDLLEIVKAGRKISLERYPNNILAVQLQNLTGIPCRVINDNQIPES
jgi:hypothetical protein